MRNRCAVSRRIVAMKNLCFLSLSFSIIINCFEEINFATAVCNINNKSMYYQPDNFGFCGDFVCSSPLETSFWCEDCSCGDGVCDYYELESMACAIDCAASLLVINQPTGVTAGLLEQQPSVVIKDANGEDSWISSTVSVEIIDSSGLVIPVFGGNKAIQSTCGTFMFTDLRVGNVGASRLRFRTTFSGVTLEAMSTTFSMTYGAAHHLRVSRNPSGIAVSIIFKNQPIIEVSDVFENIVENSTIYVTASVRSGCFRPTEDYCVLDQSLVLKGGTQRQSVGGVVTYTTLYLPGKSAGVILLFSAGDSILPARSSLLTVADIPHHLEMLASPLSGTAAGEALYPQPSIALRDASGLLSSWAVDDVKCTSGVIVRARLLCSSADSVIEDSCALANLFGNKAVKAVGGVANFTDLAIDQTGRAFSILFDVACGASRVAPVQSNLLNVSYGMAFKLDLLGGTSSFGASPGCPFALQPRVMVQDKYGNLVGDAQVMITAVLLQDNTISIVPLLGSVIQKSCKTDACECLKQDGCGIAFWGNLQINAVGKGLTMRFASTNLMSVDSFPAFDVQEGPVYSIFIIIQPSGVWPGLPFKVQPIIGMHDRAGNLVPSNETKVTAELVVTKPGGVVCSLGGVTSIVSSVGKAIFTDLKTPRVDWMDSVCNDHSKFKVRFSILPPAAASCSTSTNLGVNTVDSSLLYISASPSSLSITAQPGNHISGQRFKVPPSLSIQDQNNTIATWFNDSASTIEVVLCVNFKCPSGSYENGVEMGTPCFTCLNDEINFCQNQSETEFLATQTHLITSGFTGTLQVAAIQGEISFTDLMLKQIGTYMLFFASEGFDPVFSQPFTIFKGPAVSLGVIRQPGLAAPGAALGIQPIIALLDIGGNTIASQGYNAITAMLIALDHDGRANATLATANDVTMIAETRFWHGFSEFQGLRVDLVGTYQLRFHSGALAIRSIDFSVIAGPPFSLSIEASPDGCRFNFPCAKIPIVSVKDAGENIVFSSTAAVTASSMSLSCSWYSPPLVASAVSGVAQFLEYAVNILPTVLLDASCDGTYQIIFTSDNLKAANSRPFLVSWNAVRLAKRLSPIFAIPGSTFPHDPDVLAYDEIGRLVRTFTSSVGAKLLQCNCSDISCCAPLSGVALLGRTRVNSDSGISRFENLRVDKTGKCYRLLFESEYILSALSGPFDVTIGTSTTIVRVLQQPMETDAGTQIQTQPSVAVLDRGLNIRTDLTGQKISVVLLARGNLDLNNMNSIWSGGSPGLSQHAFLFEGRALFTDLRIDTAKCCAVMRFVFSTIYSGYTVPFIVNPGPATKLTFVVFPTDAIPGWVFDIQPILGYQDDYGNNVTPWSCKYECSRLNHEISAEICPMPEIGYEGTLLGRTSINSMNGLARFTDLQIIKAGTFILCFRSNSSFMVPAVSEKLILTPNLDRASRLSLIVQPFGAKATPTTPGSKPIPFITQPQLAITDLGKNIISAARTWVSVSIYDSKTDYTGGLCRGQSNCPLLSGNTSVYTVNGLAAFTDLSVSPPCTGLVLLFTSSDGCSSSGGLCASETSLPFDASGAVSRMAAVVMPLHEMAGFFFNIQPKVKIIDDRSRWYTYTSAIKESISVTIFPVLKNQSATQRFVASNDSYVSLSVSGKSSISCAQRGRVLINCSVRTAQTDQPKLYGNKTVDYIGGYASFTNLMLEHTNDMNGFALQFSLVATGGFVYAPLTHCCVYVSPASAENLELTSILASQVPGEIIERQPIVWFLDHFGNFVNLSDSNVSVKLLLHGSVTSASAYPITGMFASSKGGIAQFTELSCSRPGYNFSFLFISLGLQSKESDKFNVINHGKVFRLQITRSPDGFVENNPFERQPVVSALDRVDNYVDSPIQIIVSLVSPESSVNLERAVNGNIAGSTVDGHISYTDLSISKAGSNLYLRFMIIQSLEIFVDSDVFDVSKGSLAAQIKIQNNPSQVATSGQYFNIQPSLRVSDFQNLRISNLGYSVSAYLDSFDNAKPCTFPKTYRCSVPNGVCANDAGACPKLMGKTILPVTAGYANFTDLKVGPCNTDSSLDCSRGTYRINFVLNGNLRVNYSMFVNAGSAVGLIFKTVEWSSTLPAQTSGLLFTTQPQVHLIDTGGNIVTSSREQVKVTVIAGVFENQWIQLGIRRELSTLLCSQLSTACPCIADILMLQQSSAGDFSRFSYLLKLFLSRTPSTPPAESNSLSKACPCLTQPDCLGSNCSCNPSWFGSDVANSSNGIVQWTNIGISTSGLQYRLRFSMGSYVLDTGRFDVLFGIATQIQVLINPQRALAGWSFAVQPAVAVVDVGLNLVLSFSGEVSARLLPNDHSEILQGRTELKSFGGKVQYTDLWIRKVSSCYLIEFSSPGTKSAISQLFNVSYGVLFARLSILQFPSGINPGYPLQIQPVVAVFDAGDNILESFPFLIEIFLSNSSGVTNAVCSYSLNRPAAGCRTRVRAVKGMAAFTDIRVDKAGFGLKMNFRAIDNLGNVVPVQVANYGPFDVNPGVPFQLSVVRQPSTEGENSNLIGQPGQILAQQPSVVIQDAGGNQVTVLVKRRVTARLFQNGQQAALLSFPSFEPAMLLHDPALSDATIIYQILSVVQGQDGRFTFTSLRIDRAAKNYSIRFESEMLLWTESKSFDIESGAPFKLAISRPPSGFLVGAPFLIQPTITLQDRGGNVVTFSPPFLNVVASLSGPSGTFLQQSTIQSKFSNGYASFTNLGITSAGNGFALTFSSQLYSSAISSPFNVSNTGASVKIVIQPVGSIAGLPLNVQPVVCILDNRGRVVDSDFSSVVTANILKLSNPLNATISGNSVIKCCSGFCRFTDLSISKSGSSYQIEFSALSLMPDVSSSFKNGGPVSLRVLQNPDQAKSNLSFGVQPIVLVVDEASTLVSTCNLKSCNIGGDALVFVQLVPETGGQEFSALYGTTHVPISGGRAAFTDLAIQGAGGTYSSLVEPPYALRFTAVDLASVDSSFFNLSYTVRPPSGHVRAGVRVYGLMKNVFTPKQQKSFIRTVMNRLTVEMDAVQIYSVRAGVRRAGSIGPYSDVVFFVWSNSSSTLIKMASSLSSWLKRDGAFANSLSQEGLTDLTVIILLDAQAFAWDGSMLQMAVTDAVSSIIGGVVGGFFALVLISTFGIMWLRAKQRAKVRSDELGEVDMMRAIGMHDFSDNVEETALLPWTAEKLLECEGPGEEK